MKVGFSNSNHCNRPRKALHVPMQSFATANAKHCISQRKALTDVSIYTVACDEAVAICAQTDEADRNIMTGSCLRALHGYSVILWC